jgi:hypothetical protein
LILAAVGAPLIEDVTNSAGTAFFPVHGNFGIKNPNNGCHEEKN